MWQSWRDGEKIMKMNKCPPMLGVPSLSSTTHGRGGGGRGVERKKGAEKDVVKADLSPGFPGRTISCYWGGRQ